MSRPSRISTAAGARPGRATAALAAAALLLGAGAGCAPAASATCATASSCDVNVKTNSSFTTKLFGDAGADVTVSQIADNSARVTVGGTTRTVSVGEPTAVGGLRVTLWRGDPHGHEANLTITR